MLRLECIDLRFSYEKSSYIFDKWLYGIYPMSTK